MITFFIVEFLYPEKLLDDVAVAILFVGLRLDGRRPHELRRIECSMGLLTQADGSAYLEQGNTKVLATVYGPHDVSSFLSFWFSSQVIALQIFLIYLYHNYITKSSYSA